MKITRRQLRRLIKESLISEMPMIKPGLDLDDKTYSRFEKMATTDDPMTQAQVDVIASDFGYPEEKSFSSDLKSYYDLELMPFLTFSEEEVDKIIGSFFAVDPGAYQGAISQGGMSLQDIAADLFAELVEYYVREKAGYNMEQQNLRRQRGLPASSDSSWENFDKLMRREVDLLIQGDYEKVHPQVSKLLSQIEEALKKYEYDRSTGTKNWS